MRPNAGRPPEGPTRGAGKNVAHLTTRRGYTPHLSAEVNPESPKGTQWRLPCPHCSSAPGRRSVVYHYHGAGEGDRVAHCIFEYSPYCRTGYVVVFDPERARSLAEALKRRRGAA